MENMLVSLGDPYLNMGRGSRRRSGGGILRGIGVGTARTSTRASQITAEYNPTRSSLSVSCSVQELQDLKREVTSQAYKDLDTDKLKEWQNRFCGDEYFQKRLSPRSEQFTWFYRAGHVPGVGIQMMGSIHRKSDSYYISNFYNRQPGSGLGAKMLLDFIDIVKQDRANNPDSSADRIITDVFSTNSPVRERIEKYGFKSADHTKNKS